MIIGENMGGLISFDNTWYCDKCNEDFKDEDDFIYCPYCGDVLKNDWYQRHLQSIEEFFNESAKSVCEDCGEEFNKEYIQAMTENVKELNAQIEENKNSYSEVKEQNDKTIEELKTENNLLQSQMKTNLATIDFLEKQKELELQNISTKELELKAKIEKFVGAKIF